MESDTKVPVNTRLNKELVDQMDIEIRKKNFPSRTSVIEKALTFYFETFVDFDDRLAAIELKVEKLSELLDQVLSQVEIVAP